MTPVTPQFRESFNIVQRLARNRGLDLAEALNEHGMLHTEAQVLKDQMRVLTYLQTVLGDMTPDRIASIMGGSVYELTPAEMLRLVNQWLAVFIKSWGNQ